MFFNVKLNFLSRLQLMEKKILTSFFKPNLFHHAPDMVTSEVPQYSESHCRAPKPTVMEMNRVAVVQKRQKKKQKNPNVYSLDSVYCEDWNCWKKKKKKKRHLSVPRTVWLLLLCLNTKQKSPLFLIILVARCYCRFKDLFLDGRSGG